jgi:flagellar basal-body rod protein FlgF
MSKGLWPAVSGSIAQSQRLDTIANNLANSDTNGFKRDQVSFRAIYSDAKAAADKEDIPRAAYTEKDFYRLDGKDQSFVVVDGTQTDFAQGHAKVTNNPLDVLLDGKGFLQVLSPQGVRYTRQGNLKLTGEGNLVTNEGLPVLSAGGGPEPETREQAMSRAISFDITKGMGQFTITAAGEIFLGKEQVGDLGVVEFADPRLLIREGQALYRSDVAANRLTDVTATSVKQGMLEGSNVNSVSEMTEMLKATRLFEASQKIVKTYGDLEGRAVNDIGKL